MSDVCPGGRVEGGPGERQREKTGEKWSLVKHATTNNVHPHRESTHCGAHTHLVSTLVVVVSHTFNIYTQHGHIYLIKA